jgi:hypothetical protein
MRDYYSPDITPRGDPNFGSELDILNWNSTANCI